MPAKRKRESKKPLEQCANCEGFFKNSDLELFIDDRNQAFPLCTNCQDNYQDSVQGIDVGEELDDESDYTESESDYSSSDEQ